MKVTGKKALAAISLMAMALAATGGEHAMATGTSAPAPASTTPPPPEGAAGSADRGIKDNGVKGCNGCGLTGREAAPTPQATGGGNAPAPAAAERIETGQLIIRPSPNPPKVESQSPGGSAPTTATGSQEAERRAHSGPGGTPPSAATGGGPGGGPHVTTSRNRTGLLLGTLSGIAAIAFAVSSGGSDSPVSP